MALTADDIVNYPLKQAVRGYSVPQVDELLDQVAEELERRTREHDDLRDRLERAQRQLDESSETEATLKRTLVTAQRAAEQSLEEARERAATLVDDARREAAATVEQARLEAEELRIESLHAARAEEAELRNRRNELEARVEALRIFERDMRNRLRSQLEDQMRALDEVGAGVPDGAAGTPLDEGVDADSTDDTAGDIDGSVHASTGASGSTAEAETADALGTAQDEAEELEPLEDLWAEGIDVEGAQRESTERLSG